jgi:uncharacterized protein YjbI with pentapeptide repeats
MEKKFCLSDARGIKLHRRDVDSQAETITDISDSDWTDALLATENGETVFVAVQAQGARFGFTEQLIDCRARNKQAQASGKRTTVEAMNGLHGFNGARGNFQRTSWKNIDFGGADAGAIFSEANLRGAVFEGCDLSGIDFRTCNVEGVVIKDPARLDGLTITKKQAELIAPGLFFSDDQAYAVLEQLAYEHENDAVGFLKEYSISVVD